MYGATWDTYSDNFRCLVPSLRTENNNKDGTAAAGMEFILGYSASHSLSDVLTTSTTSILGTILLLWIQEFTVA